jgi:ribosomal-protein-alanine N-acetyltransferase
MDTRERDLPLLLETERLILRCYQPGDGKTYYAAARRNQHHLARYESGNVLLSPQSEAEAEKLVAELAEDWASRRSFFVGIFDKQSAEWLGQIYVGVVNWHTPEFELGYVVDRDYEGQGVITESVRAVLKQIFGALQAHRVRLRCDDTNERSYRVAERTGFVREGHLREDHRWPDGTFTGTYLYGLLQGEFDR